VTAIPKMRIARFTPVQRVFHALLMVAFLIQAATGLARMYMETGWGQSLGAMFGVYEAARATHIYVGIFMLIGIAVHAGYILMRINWRGFPASLWGPDSLTPGAVDVRQFFQHIGWFLGIRRPPDFDRWGYWEKFDYWAVFWGMTIIGVTGLMMAYPFFTTRYIPGWGLNVAFWVHRIEALLAMGHIFIIHFFIAHLRRHNFPMDRAMFEGSTVQSVSEEEKPAWVKRLKESGAWGQVLVAEVEGGRRVAFYLFGYAALFCGVFLLIGAILNLTGVSWY